MATPRARSVSRTSSKHVPFARAILVSVLVSPSSAIPIDPDKSAGLDHRLELLQQRDAVLEVGKKDVAATFFVPSLGLQLLLYGTGASIIAIMQANKEGICLDEVAHVQWAGPLSPRCCYDDQHIVHGICCYNDWRVVLDPGYENVCCNWNNPKEWNAATLASYGDCIAQPSQAVNVDKLQCPDEATHLQSYDERIAPRCCYDDQHVVHGVCCYNDWRVVLDPGNENVCCNWSHPEEWNAATLASYGDCIAQPSQLFT